MINTKLIDIYGVFLTANSSGAERSFLEEGQNIHLEPSLFGPHFRHVRGSTR